jgi:hypothetical protein
MHHRRWAVLLLAVVVLPGLFVTLHLMRGNTVQFEIGPLPVRASDGPLAAVITCAAAALAWALWRHDPTRRDAEDRRLAEQVIAAAHEDERRWNPAWSRAIGFGCAAYVAGLLIWCGWAIAPGVPDAFSGGDGAVLELYTLYASRGQWALGPYSRFGWYHPGPSYIYSLVPFYLASGQHPLGLTVGAAAINVIAFAGIAWTLCRHASGVMSVAVVAMLAAYLWRVPDVLTSLWNPHVLLLPYALLIVSGAVVASGRLALLPLIALLATFVTQTHVGLGPAAIAVGGGALIAGVRMHHRLPRHSVVTGWSLWLWLGVSTLVLLIVWLPPLYDQVAGTGNMGRLLTFFGSKADRPLAKETLTVWTGTLLQPLTANLRTAWGGALPPMPRDTWVAWFAVSEVLLLFFGGEWAAGRGRFVEAWLCRLSVIASLVALLAIGRIRGGVVDHLTFWNTITGTLNAGVLLGIAMMWITEIMPLRRARAWPTALVPIVCLLVVLVLANDCAATLRQRRAQLIAGQSAVPPVGRLYQTTRAAIARARLHKPLIELRGPWADAAGMLVQLYKHGIPVGVEHPSAWLYGAPIGERGDEDGAVTIADTEAGAKVARDPNECLIAWANGTFVFMRAPTPEQSAKLRCAPFEIASQ